MDLMGSDALQSEVAMRRMWADSMKAVKCQNARITYDDFLLLMKGQTRENPVSRSASPVHATVFESTVPSLVPTTKLHVVPEGEHSPDVNVFRAPPKLSNEISNPDSVGKALAKNPSPSALRPKFSESLESPLSMDDDDDLFHAAGPGVPGSVASLTPPSSPVRGATDYVTPRSGRKNIEFISGRTGGIELPGLDITSDGSKSESYVGRGDLIRKRSVSYDDKDKKDDSETKDESENRSESESRSEKLAGPEELNAVADIVRDMLLPETDHTHKKGGLGVDDKSKSALVVNRNLYRAHRQMRLAVLEASKRFEEQQAEHAKELLMARQAKEVGATTAGLVMRHGYNKQVSSEAIRQLLSENKAQQQQLVAMASRKGGRGRRTRKKTISDMSGMLSTIGTEDMSGPAPETFAEPPALAPAKSSPAAAPEVVEVPAKKLESEGPSRAATVPGDFRTTTDPFSPKGKYGAITTPL